MGLRACYACARALGWGALGRRALGWGALGRGALGAALATALATSVLLWAQGVRAEEPAAGTPAAGTAPAKATPPKKASQARGSGTASATPPPAKEASSSGATETIALEIVAKAPKPIPPVELDMLQLRLMLTDLKASFTDKIDEALFHEPF